MNTTLQGFVEDVVPPNDRNIQHFDGCNLLHGQTSPARVSALAGKQPVAPNPRQPYSVRAVGWIGIGGWIKEIIQESGLDRIGGEGMGPLVGMCVERVDRQTLGSVRTEHRLQVEIRNAPLFAILRQPAMRVRERITVTQVVQKRKDDDSQLDVVATTEFDKLIQFPR